VPRRTFDIPGEESDYESNFTPYAGPEPKVNAVYRVQVDGCWLKQTENGDDRIVFLLKVCDKPSKQKRYAGAPFWEGVNMTQKSMWKYVEILKALGVPFKQGKTIVTGKVENEKLGEPVTKIGQLKITDDIELLIKTKMGKSKDGLPQLGVGTWLALPADMDDDAEDEAEAEEDEDEAGEDGDEDEDDAPF
jgi:hypothetical protein